MCTRFSFKGTIWSFTQQTCKMTLEKVEKLLCDSLRAAKVKKSFVTTSSLQQILKGHRLGCTATIRSGRMGRCPLKTKKCLKDEGRGSLDFRSEKDSGIIICHWHDNRSLTIGSNTHSIGPVGVCRCYDKKTKSPDRAW